MTEVDCSELEETMDLVSLISPAQKCERKVFFDESNCVYLKNDS